MLLDSCAGVSVLWAEVLRPLSGFNSCITACSRAKGFPDEYKMLVMHSIYPDGINDVGNDLIIPLTRLQISLHVANAIHRSMFIFHSSMHQQQLTLY